MLHVLLSSKTCESHKIFAFRCNAIILLLHVDELIPGIGF